MLQSFGPLTLLLHVHLLDFFPVKDLDGDSVARHHMLCNLDLSEAPNTCDFIVLASKGSGLKAG